jgi:hypothetical protein
MLTMRPLLTLPLIVASGLVAERVNAPPRLAPAGAAVADSASICWQRFSRGIPVEANCTTLSVIPRIDTVQVPVITPVALPPTGIPWGPMNLMRGAGWRFGRSPHPFNGNMSVNTPASLPQQIEAARKAGVRLFLEMTGGAHSQFVDPLTGRFSFDLWWNRQLQYNTEAVRAAVDSGYRDGTIRGVNVMDEPNHPSWGKLPDGRGALSKATVDSMCALVKSLFAPPCGVIATHTWMPDSVYRVVDFVIDQYNPLWKGDQAQWIRGARAFAARNGVKLVPSLNLIDWTKQKLWLVPCPIPATGGPGSAKGDLGVKGCRITPQQFRDAGIPMAQIPEACGMTAWQNDSTMFGKIEYLGAAAEIRVAADRHPATDCRRASH